MSGHWDLAVYNQEERLTLVVEVKPRLNTSAEWAARLRHNILAHGTFPTAPYFLLAFPDRFYLWANAARQVGVQEPDYTIDARPLLQPYYEQLGLEADEASSQSLEFIVSSWLGQIVHAEPGNQAADELPQWVVASGLYGAIAQGSLSHEVVA